MNQFKNFSIIREEIIKKRPTETSIFIARNGNSLFYRFLFSENGVERDEPLIRKNLHNTSDVYKQILNDFLNKIKIISSEDIKQVGHSTDAYKGIVLQNIEGEILNLYYASNALFAYEEMKTFIETKIEQDIYKNGICPIEKRIVKRMIFSPTKKAIGYLSYIFDNKEYDNYHIKVQKQLNYYYEKHKNEIERKELKEILYFIRLFINANLKLNPKYKYLYNERLMTSKLMILFEKDVSLEISDFDLIDAIEHARIIDDLWLVMRGLIPKMPMQEESMKDKEVLRALNRKYRNLA